MLNELSRRRQQQHDKAMFEREQKAIRDSEQARRAHDLANEMLEILRLLNLDLPAFVGSRRSQDEDRERRVRDELSQLWRLAITIPEPVLHERVELTHTILEWADDIAEWGNVRFWPRQVVSIAANDAIKLVSAYLRGEQVVAELDERMLILQKGYETALKEREWQENELRREVDGRVATNSSESDEKGSTSA